MGTVAKDIADEIVSHNGYYIDPAEYSGPDNPLYSEITEYDNIAGGKAYGLTMKGSKNVYVPSPYVRNPRTYWKLKED